MSRSGFWSPALLSIGLAALLIGAVDPLEGSMIILPGSAMVALGAFLGRSSYRKLLYWAFGLTAVGIAALFGWSAVGGLGGATGRSGWWGLTLLPYPTGWLMGLVGVVLIYREHRREGAETGAAR